MLMDGALLQFDMENKARGLADSTVPKLVWCVWIVWVVGAEMCRKYVGLN